jgi:glycosyltransferase involved in cell wall biosynthesis
MRVVQVIPNFGIGGIQKAGCLLAAGLASTGHEVTVVGGGDGPRRLDEPPRGVRHLVVNRTDDQALSRTLLALQPDVVHLHARGYEESLIAALAAQFGTGGEGPLIVMTPVFGRPPTDRQTLYRCRTCLIGAYVLYRQRLWMGMSGDEASQHGVGFVWLNSFERAEPPQNTLDMPDIASARRELLGVPQGAFVIGRIGRETPDKWHACYPTIIEQVLTAHPDAAWLSIGYPEQLGRADLARRFGPRFVNHPQTVDYLKLARAFASMDLQAFFSPWGECFSTTICEAAGVGLPTISGVNPIRDNGQTEQIIDGINGFLVGTPSQAVERIGDLLTHPNVLDRMKRETFEYAHARWTTERTIGDLLAFYDAWRGSDPLATPYIKWVRQQEAHFAANYRSRMLALLADGPLSRSIWRFKLAAAANWNTFRIGGRLKQWID